MTETNKADSVLKAAWLIALVTIASKFMGFVRDMVVANFYGATLVSDAYFYALQIPSLAIIILGGVGGPFHSAAVAVFSKLIPNFDSKPDETVNKLYNNCFFYIFCRMCNSWFLFCRQSHGHYNLGRRSGVGYACFRTLQNNVAYYTYWRYYWYLLRAFNLS